MFVDLKYFPFCTAHHRVRYSDRGMKAQGCDLKKNVYNSRFQPYVVYWGIFWTVFLILMNGFAVFFDFIHQGKSLSREISLSRWPSGFSDKRQSYFAQHTSLGFIKM